VAAELEAARLDEQRLTELYQSELEKAKLLDNQWIEEQQAMEAIQRVRSLHGSIPTQLRQLQLQNEAVADGRSGIKVTVLAAPAPQAATQQLQPVPMAGESENCHET
jgi:hypothetical protein